MTSPRARVQFDEDSSGLPRLSYSLVDRLPIEVLDIILRFCWNTPTNQRASKSLPLVCRLFFELLDPLRFSSLNLIEGHHTSTFDVLEVDLNSGLSHWRNRPVRWRYLRSVVHNGAGVDIETGTGSVVSPAFVKFLNGGFSADVPIMHNLTSIRISYCLIDATQIRAMQALPSLKVIHISSALISLHNPQRLLEAAIFRLSEIDLSDIEIEHEDAIALVSAFSSPHLKTLSLADVSPFPPQAFRAIASAVYPQSIKKLSISSIDIEDAAFVDFLVSQNGIRQLTYYGSFQFSLLPSSALPELEECHVFRTDIESLVRGRPICHPRLDRAGKLHIETVFPVDPNFFSKEWTNFSPLHSLTTLALPPEINRYSAPEDDLINGRRGQLELLKQHRHLGEMEGICPKLCSLDMFPFHWIKLDVGDWRPYRAGSAKRYFWDQPLEIPTDLSLDDI